MKYPNDFINKIICGNCLDIMKYIPNDTIDLTVTSPPYDGFRRYKGYNFDFENISNELFRITKSGGILVWIVGDATIKGSETGTSFKQALYFKDIGFNLHDTMIYQKRNPMPHLGHGIRYNPSFEFMFILSKGRPKTINLIQEDCIYAGGIYSGKEKWGREKNGKLRDKKIMIGKQIKDKKDRTNIWIYSIGSKASTKDKIAYNHPAIFPEQLAEDHIISWSNENDIILDPMCGSGTTCKMAKLNNRNFIGIDVSDTYCRIAKDRIFGGEEIR